MTRAGERVKGTTSARQLSGYPLGSQVAGRLFPALMGARRFSKGGVVKSLGLPKAGNRLPCHWQIFSVICEFSDAVGHNAATPSHVRQAGAARCYALPLDREELIPMAQRHRLAWQIKVRTERTVRTATKAGRISADRAVGSCSHWPARDVRTVGTEERRVAEGQKPRALVASPARSPSGVWWYDG